MFFHGVMCWTISWLGFVSVWMKQTKYNVLISELLEGLEGAFVTFGQSQFPTSVYPSSLDILVLTIRQLT